MDVMRYHQGEMGKLNENNIKKNNDNEFPKFLKLYFHRKERNLKYHDKNLLQKARMQQMRANVGEMDREKK